jgi:hypothetical protein
MSTITLNSIRRKAPVEKNNIVEVNAYIDGKGYWMAFSIPLSGMVIGSQKTKSGVEDMFTQALTSKFGKVQKL